MALLTDFGTQDWYVAAMRGVCRTLAPAAALVDVSHDLPAGDVRAGAFVLSQCWRQFPVDTVFLGVVDPGVGTARAALAWREPEGRIFVGPDNGLFSFLGEFGEARYLSQPRDDHVRVSPTFHGRDVFAPFAARLAAGMPFAQVGPILTEPVMDALPGPGETETAWFGEVLWVDAFGNLVTNFGDSITAALPEKATLHLGVGEQAMAAPWVRTFGEVPEGTPLAYRGSGGFLELALSGGSLAARLKEGRGARVSLRRP